MMPPIKPLDELNNNTQAMLTMLEHLIENVATKDDIEAINLRLDEHDRILVKGSSQPSMIVQQALLRQDYDSFKNACAFRHSDTQVNKSSVTWDYLRQFVVQPIIIGVVLYFVTHVLLAIP